MIYGTKWIMCKSRWICPLHISTSVVWSLSTLSLRIVSTSKLVRIFYNGVIFCTFIHNLILSLLCDCGITSETFYLTDILKHDHRSALLLQLAPQRSNHFRHSLPCLVLRDTNFYDPALPVDAETDSSLNNSDERVMRGELRESAHSSELEKMPNVVDVKDTHTVGIGVVFPQQGSECSVIYTRNGGESIPLITEYKKTFQNASYQSSNVDIIPLKLAWRHRFVYSTTRPPSPISIQLWCSWVLASGKSACEHHKPGVGSINPRWLVDQTEQR